MHAEFSLRSFPGSAPVALHGASYADRRDAMPNLPSTRSGVFRTVAPEPKILHVRPRTAGWALCSDDALRPLSLHARQADALMLAVTLARHSGATVLVHDPDGRCVRHDPWTQRAG